MNVASILKLIATFAWILFLAAIVIVIVRASRDRSTKAPLTFVFLCLGIAVVLTVISAGLVFMQPEDRGAGHSVDCP